MKECKKMIVLIMVFALCFGFSACGGGGSDNNDTVENEDDRGSGGSESDIYDSTDTVQYMASMESDNDNPAKQLGYSSIEEMRIQEHEIIASLFLFCHNQHFSFLLLPFYKIFYLSRQ